MVVVLLVVVVLVGVVGVVGGRESTGQGGEADCYSVIRELYPATRDDIALFSSATYNATLVCIACARETAQGDLQPTTILQDILVSVGAARDNMVKQALYFDMVRAITASALETWSTSLLLAATNAAEAANIPTTRIASDPALIATVVDQGFQATLLSPRFFDSFATSLRNQSLRHTLVMRSLAACDTDMLTLLGETWTAHMHDVSHYSSPGAAADDEDSFEADLHWMRNIALPLCQQLVPPTVSHPTARGTTSPRTSCSADCESCDSADASGECEDTIVSDTTPPHCSRVLPVVDGDTTSTALRRHFRFGVPAVIRTSHRADELRDLLSWSELPTTFEGEDLALSAIPYGDVFGVRAGVATVEEYQHYTVNVVLNKLGLREQDLFEEEVEADACRQLIDKDGTALTPPPLYIFDHAALPRVLPNRYHLPPAVERMLKHHARENPVHQLIIGPPCSGSPVHFHQNAVNVLLSGSKRWWLQPPVLKSYSKLHPLLAPLDPPTCIQEEGDIVFVPRGWAHATLNTRHVSGFAIEM